MHEAPNSGVRRDGEQVTRPVHHDPLKLLGATLPDRDEMDDRVDASNRRAQARRIGDIALGKLATPRRQPGSPTQVTHEAGHGEVAAAELVNDVTADETGATRDEDQPVGAFWKFCQYLEGVGPRWPWYLEPISPVPYGVCAGSVSWTNEIWPIFISG